ISRLSSPWRSETGCERIPIVPVPLTNRRQPTPLGIVSKKIVACLAHVSQFPEGEANLDWMRRLDTESAKLAGLEGRLFERFGQLTLW
ncbi:MAG: hypothetical protein ABJA50_11815, partial [Chloroflexota bacterium]